MRRYFTQILCAILLSFGPLVTAQTSKAESDWTGDYASAVENIKTNPTAACAELRRLAAVPDAPIAALAHARDLQLCNAAKRRTR